jgi:hypothetical protein
VTAVDAIGADRAAVAVHPVVAAPLRAFCEAGVRWCLLRGASEAVRLGGDVDLLVDPRDLAVVRRLLCSDNGFAELRAWGRGPHRFFVAYVETEGAWAKLDVVTALRFGRWQQLPTGAAGAVLAAARDDGVVALPAPADAFWLALLHALLDRDRVRPERARELTRLARAAPGAGGPLAAVADAASPPGWSAARIVDAAARARLPELLALAPALRARWPGAPRAVRAARAGLRIALRRLDRARPRRPGPTVALVGGPPRARADLAAALTAAWPERSVALDGAMGPAWAAARARGRLVVLQAPGGGAAASRADVRVCLGPGHDLLGARRSALGAAWRVAQQRGRMTWNSRSRSTG